MSFRLAGLVAVLLASPAGLAAPRALAERQVLAPAVSGTGAIGDRYGRTIAFDGDTLLVAAIGDEVVDAASPGGRSSGSVTVYRAASSAYAREATLVPSVASGDDRYGFALALSGEVAAIGAPFEDDEAIEDRGVVYVYERSGAQWSERARLRAPDAAAGDLYGHALALDGDTLVVGAPGAADAQGKVYRYVRIGDAYTLVATIDGEPGDEAGRALAIGVDAIFVGAPSRDAGGAADAGAVLCVPRVAAACADPVLESSPARAGARYGATLAASGGTLVVGAPGESIAGQPAQGAAYVLDAGASGAVERARLVAPDGDAEDAFGSAVAIDAGRVAAGAPGALVAEGAAYVFRAEGSDWVFEQSFSEPDALLLDLFGASVALAGDTLAVGIELDSVGPNRAQGSVATFVRDALGWTAGARLDTGDGASREQFGISVDVSDTLAIAGSPLDDPAIDFDDAGTASVYRFEAGALVREARLVASDAFTQDFFGYAVGVSEDHAIAGAPRAIVGELLDRGAAYVFRRDGGTWTESSKLVAPDGGGGSFFGAAVAIDGDAAIVGAPFEQGGGFEEGAAYAYRRSGAQWVYEQRLVSPEYVAFGVAGLSVAVDGDIAVIGAPDSDVGGVEFAGLVHVFARGAGVWQPLATLTAPAPVAGGAFGSAVALDGELLVVGAAQEPGGALAAAGAAYVYRRDAADPQGYAFEARIASPAPAASALFGASVAVSGASAVVGSIGDDTGGTNAGAAFVYAPGTGGWAHIATLQASTPQARALFGGAVAASPRHVLVGEPRRDRDNPDEGAAYLYADDELLFADGFE